MDNFTPRITSMQNSATLDDNGRPVKATRVTFYVGALGPFFNDFPEGKDKPVDINGFVDAKAAEVRATVGRNY